MTRATKAAYFGNLEWQARSWGYNDAPVMPIMADIDSLIARTLPNVQFSMKQKMDLLGSAEYAYMMRLRHRSA